jgi:hypothetical protein
MKVQRTLLLLTALTLAVTIAPTAAHGQSIIKRPFGGSRPMQLDVHAGFSFVGRGLATGARFGIPLMHNGFIKSINNAVYINFGLDLYFVNYKYARNDSYAVGLGIPVTLHWEFYFTPRWSAFGEVGPNIYIHPGALKGHGWDWSPGHWFTAGVGGRFFLSESMALTLRLGTPYSSFGVTFMF